MSHHSVLKESHYFQAGISHHSITKKPDYFLMGMGDFLDRDGSLINGNESPLHFLGAQLASDGEESHSNDSLMGTCHHPILNDSITFTGNESLISF